MQQARSGQFDLLVLDVGLPDMSSFDVCGELRRFSLLPIIFLSTRGSKIDRLIGLEIGADDYMVKPLSPRELAARIRVVLRRLDHAVGSAGQHAPEAGVAVALGGFELDQSACASAMQARRYN